jgi:hypothetical protein
MGLMSRAKSELARGQLERVRARILSVYLLALAAALGGATPAVAQEADSRSQDSAAPQQELEAPLAFDRTGLYIGASGFYAPEAFSERRHVVVKSTKGAMARVGYRFHANLAADVRFDYLDGFKIGGNRETGKIEAYSVTSNLRFLLFTKRFQPWFAMGVGVIRSDFKARNPDGTKAGANGRDTDPLVRLAAGLDTYLSSHIVLTLEVAMNLATDNRDYINYSQLGVGLDYRF